MAGEIYFEHNFNHSRVDDEKAFNFPEGQVIDALRIIPDTFYYELLLINLDRPDSITGNKKNENMSLNNHHLIKSIR